jgi:hypothetical protein
MEANQGNGLHSVSKLPTYFCEYGPSVDFDLVVTGCIRPRTFDRLVPSDAGGRYDNDHPVGSTCQDYKQYVEVSLRSISYVDVYLRLSTDRRARQS